MTECLVCGATQPAHTIGSDAGGQRHLCDACWDNRLDDEIRTTLLDERILTQTLVGEVLEVFFDETEPRSGPKFPIRAASLLPDESTVTPIRRAETEQLYRLSGVDEADTCFFGDVQWPALEQVTPEIAEDVLAQIEASLPLPRGGG